MKATVLLRNGVRGKGKLVANARATVVGAVLAIAGLQSGASFALDAAYVGDGKCIVCHVDDNRHFSHTRHAKIFRLNPKTERERHGCEACHGPGSKHVANALDKDRASSASRASGARRSRSRTRNASAATRAASACYWAGSPHALNQHRLQRLPQSDGAAVAATGLLRDRAHLRHLPALPPAAARGVPRRSHMPLPEGKMSCADCHNPHGSVTRPLLQGRQRQRNVCTACHAEKRGPFLWEHAPVRESCLNCHTPHGSNHDFLLVGARPFLCQQCHSPPLGHPGAVLHAGQTAAAAQQPGGVAERAHDRPLLPELPLADPRQQPSVGRALPALTRAERALHLDGTWKSTMRFRHCARPSRAGLAVAVAPIGSLAGERRFRRRLR